MDNPSAKLVVASDPKHLSSIRDFVKDAADKVGFSETEMEEIRLAVDEACANIMIHGYGHSEGSLIITADFLEDRLIIRIVDQAKKYDPLSSARSADLDAPLEERVLGGMGVILMKQGTDTLEYNYTENNENMLIMSKFHHR